MEKLISVIIPVYNVEEYVDICISSVCNQSYKNLEIILIDDGSTDSSSIKCDEYAKKDERIRVIHKKNEGLSSARNAGLEHSIGEYVAFVDSDDTIQPEFIETLYRLCEETNSEIAQCRFEYTFTFAESNVVTNENPKIQVINNVEAVKSCCLKLDSIQFNVVWNKLYKRELFKTIRFPEGRLHEDEFVTYKVFYETTHVVLTDAILYNYLQRENSIINKTFSIGRLDKIDAYVERYQFLMVWGLVDEAKRILLKAFELAIYFQRFLSSTRDDNILRAQSRLYMQFDNLKKEIKELNGLTDFQKQELLRIELDNNDNALYQFPFHLVEQGKRIAVYGAAEIGCAYCDQIIKSENHELVIVVDKRWFTLKKENEKVQAVEQLLKHEYDYVVVAVALRETAESIKKELVTMGVLENKIIWESPMAF